MKNKSFKKMAILGAITTLVSMESFSTTLNCPNAALGLGNTCPVVGTSGDIKIIAISSNTPITSNQLGDGITAAASFGNIDIQGSALINAKSYGISSKVSAGNPSLNYTNYIHGNFGDINASTGIYQENFGLGTIKISGNFNNINGNSGNGIEILSGGAGNGPNGASDLAIGGSDVEIALNGATVTAKHGGNDGAIIAPATLKGSDGGTVKVTSVIRDGYGKVATNGRLAPGIYIVTFSADGCEDVTAGFSVTDHS